MGGRLRWGEIDTRNFPAILFSRIFPTFFSFSTIFPRGPERHNEFQPFLECFIRALRFFFCYFVARLPKFAKSQKISPIFGNFQEITFYLKKNPHPDQILPDTKVVNFRNEQICENFQNPLQQNCIDPQNHNSAIFPQFSRHFSSSPPISIYPWLFRVTVARWSYPVI